MRYQVDWEGADLTTLTKVNQSQTNPFSHPSGILKENPHSLHHPPLLCFLYTSSAEVFVSFPRETVGHFQREGRWGGGAADEARVENTGR